MALMGKSQGNSMIDSFSSVITAYTACSYWVVIEGNFISAIV